MTETRTSTRCVLAASFGIAVLLTAAANAQAVAPLQSGDSISLPFEYSSNRNSLLVRVAINGKRALLILDTGSAHTVLQPEVVGLRRKELSPAHTSSGGGFSGDAVGKEVTLQVGDRVWSRYRIAVMDLSQVLAAYQEDLDGVLGLDFLQNYSQIVIDLHQRRITLSR